jgi:hypothetical protein
VGLAWLLFLSVMASPGFRRPDLASYHGLAVLGSSRFAGLSDFFSPAGLG